MYRLFVNDKLDIVDQGKQVDYDNKFDNIEEEKEQQKATAYNEL